MEIKFRQRGSFAILALLVIGFLSWTIFSTSLLLSEETLVLHDKYKINNLENQRSILENISCIYIKKINEKIKNKFSDILEYVVMKDQEFLFLNNFENEPLSNGGFRMTRLIIKTPTSLVTKYDFSKNNKNYNYFTCLRNSSDSFGNHGYMIFQKKIKDISIEGYLQKYTLLIEGDVYIQFDDSNKRGPFNINDLKHCEIKEMRFKIVDA